MQGVVLDEVFRYLHRTWCWMVCLGSYIGCSIGWCLWVHTQGVVLDGVFGYLHRVWCWMVKKYVSQVNAVCYQRRYLPFIAFGWIA